FLDLGAVGRAREIGQVALVEEQRPLRVARLPVGLRDVVQEQRIGLVAVAVLPGLDRVVELTEVEEGLALLDQLARLPRVLLRVRNAARARASYEGEHQKHRSEATSHDGS